MDMQISLSASLQRIVLNEIRIRLTYQPLGQNTNRKPLRPEQPYPIRFWELRADKLRVFYEVDEAAATVYILAVGKKERERFYIRNQPIASADLYRWLLDHRTDANGE